MAGVPLDELGQAVARLEARVEVLQLGGGARVQRLEHAADHGAAVEPAQRAEHRLAGEQGPAADLGGVDLLRVLPGDQQVAELLEVGGGDRDPALAAQLGDEAAADVDGVLGEPAVVVGDGGAGEADPRGQQHAGAAEAVADDRGVAPGPRGAGGQRRVARPDRGHQLVGEVAAGLGLTAGVGVVGAAAGAPQQAVEHRGDRGLAALGDAGEVDAAQARGLAAAGGQQGLGERGELLGEVEELAREGHEARLEAGVGLAELADRAQGAAVEGGAQAVEAGAQLLQDQLVAAAVGQLEAEGLAARGGVVEQVGEAGEAVDLGDHQEHRDLHAELLLEVAELAREVLAELGGVGDVAIGEVVGADDHDDAVERLVVALSQLLQGAEPRAAQGVAAGEVVRDLEVHGVAGGAEAAHAVVGGAVGRVLAGAVAVDLDEAGGAGGAEQRGLAVAGQADEGEPRRGEAGAEEGPRLGGAALVADELAEGLPGLLQAGALGEHGGVDGRGVLLLGGAPGDDLADQRDDQGDHPDHEDDVDDEERGLLGDPEPRGHLHDGDRAGEQHGHGDEELHGLTPSRRSARR